MVLAHRIQDPVLVVGRQRGQGLSERWADPPPRQFALRLGRERGREFQASGDPVRLASQQLGDGPQRQVIVSPQGLHHPGLVQRGDRSRGRVGQQQESLVLDGGQRSFYDRTDLKVAVLDTSSELLEPIEDLVVAVLRGNHSQRWVRQLDPAPSHIPRPE